MLKIDITQEDKIELHYQRYNHPHPHVQKKMETLYLKSLDKLSHELIAEIAGISQNTMLGYFREYKKGGIEKLKEINFYRPQSKLVEYQQTIEQYFLKNLPASLSEASAKIEQLTGIKRGLTQTGKYLKSIGMTVRKVGSIPGKAITESKKKSKKSLK
jgi:transposase